jgi:hypothetical protein
MEFAAISPKTMDIDDRTAAPNFKGHLVWHTGDAVINTTPQNTQYIIRQSVTGPSSWEH